MANSYNELKKIIVNNNSVEYIIITFIFCLIILFSFYKTTKYESCTVIENSGKYVITCEKNCNLIKKSSFFNYGKEKISYIIMNHENNLYEIYIDKKIKKNEIMNVGIFNGKTSVISYLINIFKEKGVI